MLLLVGAPCASGVMCVHTARPVAESLERGGGGPHGLPGCSAPVAWALAPIQREVAGSTTLYAVIALGGMAGGIALIVAGVAKR